MGILDDLLTLLLAYCLAVVVWKCCVKVLLDFAGCSDD